MVYNKGGMKQERCRRVETEDNLYISGYTDKKQWWEPSECTKGASGQGGGDGLLGVSP